MTNINNHYKKLLSLAKEIQLARVTEIYRNHLDSQWDDYVTLADETVLLSLGFKYSPLYNFIMYARDLNGVEWQAWLREGHGLTGQVLFSTVHTRGSTSERKPMRYSKLLEQFKEPSA